MSLCSGLLGLYKHWSEIIYEIERLCFKLLQQYVITRWCNISYGLILSLVIRCPKISIPPSVPVVSSPDKCQDSTITYELSCDNKNKEITYSNFTGPSIVNTCPQGASSFYISDMSQISCAYPKSKFSIFHTLTKNFIHNYSHFCFIFCSLLKLTRGRNWFM